MKTQEKSLSEYIFIILPPIDEKQLPALYLI